MIQINLADSDLESLLKQHIDTLGQSDKSDIAEKTSDTIITALVDGRGLACPMPLLKTKVALRSVKEGDSVYVLATDPNSQADLTAFCNQSGLDMVINTSSSSVSQDSLEKLDTIFHVMITKTNGN